MPDFERLVKSYQYIIIEREQEVSVQEQIVSNPVLRRFNTHFNILEHNPYKNISSTEVRTNIKNRNEQAIQQMIPKDVYEYIKEKNLYY